MLQRSRNSAAVLLIGTVGCLVTVGAVVFGVVQLRYLAAAEAPAAEPVDREQPVGGDVDFPPLPAVPVPTLQPLPATRPVAAARPSVVAGSLRRVPAFTEMETNAAAALETPVTISFEETDLKSALEKLSELAGVSIRPAVQAGFEEALGYDNANPLTLDFKDLPLKSVLRTVFKMAFELNADSLGHGVKVVAAATDGGIEIGVAGYGSPDNRDTRFYLVGHLLNDRDDAAQIINLLQNHVGGYWNVPTDDGRGGILIGRMVMTGADDDDVYAMTHLAGTITHLKSMGALVVDANPQAHFEITRMLRMLDEVHQISTPTTLPAQAIPLGQPVPLPVR